MNILLLKVEFLKIFHHIVTQVCIPHIKFFVLVQLRMYVNCVVQMKQVVNKR